MPGLSLVLPYVDFKLNRTSTSPLFHVTLIFKIFSCLNWKSVYNTELPIYYAQLQMAVARGLGWPIIGSAY